MGGRLLALARRLSQPPPPCALPSRLTGNKRGATALLPLPGVEPPPVWEGAMLVPITAAMRARSDVASGVCAVPVRGAVGGSDRGCAPLPPSLVVIGELASPLK
jgi:hypothetical protein